MAHQYSSAPPYGAQYPPAPYYSPFAPAAGQQVSNGAPGFSQQGGHNQHVQTPTAHSNAVRYDANANILQQPVSMPFAPHFNPELLKHFAHHPPPPPPPAAHFVPLPGTATGFPQFPPTVNSPALSLPQQNYSHFPQPPTTPGGGSYSNQGLNPGQEQRSYSQHTPTHEPGKSNDQVRRQISPAPAVFDVPTVEPSINRPFDAAPSSSSMRQAPMSLPDFQADISKPLSIGTNGSIEQTNPPAEAASIGPPESGQQTQTNIPNMVPRPHLQSETKERAKAALLSLIPYNIRYDSFVAEGVSPRILQQLYEELGLNWQIQEARSYKESRQATDTVMTDQQTQPLIKGIPSATTNNPSVTVPTSLSAKLSPSATPISRASPTISPNIERKDRIAQLLAAKAGKASAPAINSKSQSPASAAEIAHNPSVEPEAFASTSKSQSPKPGRNLAQAEIVRQKMEQLKKEAIARARAEQEQITHETSFQTNNVSPVASAGSQAQVSTMLPTPVREQLAQGGFSSLIPGLFMTSAESDDADASSSWFGRGNNGEQQALMGIIGSHNQRESIVPSRKRPIAEDLSSDNDPHAKRSTKQFGDQIDMPADEPMHDAEASDGEIIEDESTAIAAHAEPAPDNQSVPTTQTIQANQDYVSKQTEIDSMRKRIAEIEQRQNSKRSQSYVQSPTGSGTPTPTLSFGTQTLLSSPQSKMPDQPFGSARAEDRTNQSPISFVKATPEQIAAKAAQLKADFLRQRALRQKQLQEGIPVLNDELVKIQGRAKEAKAKLAQVQTELQQYESDISRAREDEKQLLQEIQRLEKQISDGESGQKRFSNELNDLKQQTPKDQTVQVTPAESKTEHALQTSAVANDQVSGGLSDPQANQSLFENRDKDVSVTSAEQQRSANSADGSSNSFEPSPASEPTSQVDHEPEAMEETSDSNKPNGDIDSIPISNSTLATLDVQPLIPMEQAQDSDEAMEESDDDSGDSHMSIDDDTNDSASMSDSGSEEYEPAEPELSQKSEEKMESDEYEPEIENGQQSDEMVDEEEEEEADDYEPTDSYNLLETPNVSSTPVPFQLSSTTVAPERVEVNTSTSHDSPIEAPQISESTQYLGNDDLENGLQLSEADTLIKSQHKQSDEEADGSHVLGVTETSSVKDGYRSLTYSHKIDPKLPICPTELEGVVCSDPQCQDQHFGSMALTDDKILVQMSSANDIKDKGPRDQYLIGLKQVIARLRQEGVKEFSAVADALSQYRREWIAAQGSI